MTQTIEDIADEHIITRQGKPFVLYAGLLDAAHRNGLRSIETELIQVPGIENNNVAIVKAVIRTEEGKFSGIGDASPENVSRNIVPHIIRMAETRSKARALRDAINVSGYVDDSDLGEEEESAPDLAAVEDLKGAAETSDLSHNELIQRCWTIAKLLPEDQKPERVEMARYIGESSKHARHALNGLIKRAHEAGIEVPE